MHLVPALLLTTLASNPLPGESLLSAVPEDAFALLHVSDPIALRSRVERNDWAKAYAALEGEPALLAVKRGYEAATGTDYDGLFELALELHGEALLFFSEDVAGFLTEAPPDRTALLSALNRWLPAGPQRAVDVAGGRVVLVAWPEADAATGRYLALLDHPLALGLYAGDSAEAALASLSDSIEGLRHNERAEVVEGFLASGGGTTGGVEAYVDFTPFVGAAEAELRKMVEGVLPDPTGLLGLERGTSLFVSADVSPGTRVEVRARLSVPAGTLAAQLADCYEPLPITLPDDLPRETWAMWALDWNPSRFYRTARAGLERGEAGGLVVVDQGLAVAEAISGVDPIEDVMHQLAGWFAWYHVLNQGELPAKVEDGFGFLVGLVDGSRFLKAFETMLGKGGLGVDAIELEGAETYLASQEGFMGADAKDLEGIDGGLSILPTRLLVSLSRETLVRGLRALAKVDGAGLRAHSGLQAAFDENPGAFAFGYAELSHVRTLASLEAGLPPDENDPFESQLIITARRTAGGFEARLYTR